MTTTNIRPTGLNVVSHHVNRHRDNLDTRDAGTGVLKGITVGGPLGSLSGMIVLTLAIPSLGPDAMLAGIIIGLVAGIVLGAFGGLYTTVRNHEDTESRAIRSYTEPQTLQHYPAD